MHLKLFAPLVAGLALTTYATGGLSSGIWPPPPKVYIVAEVDVKDLAA
nr:hypothetical protein [Altererythrobacter segetis]